MTSTPSQLSQLKDFLGYIATVKGDLSNVTAPPFVLARKSATEFPAAWCSHQDLFLDQAAHDEPEQRALAVLKNFLASLKTQTYAGAGEEEGAKKPLNAFLGELFLAQFDTGDDSATKLISEQVSHHPPVTACCMYNEAHGISAEGYVSQEALFSAATGVKVNQIGHALIHLQKHNEHHLLTLPTLNVKSILSGSPYPELSGVCHIVSTSGFTSRIEFEGKKLLGVAGKKNSLHAELFRTHAPHDVLYRVEGQWNARFAVHDVRAAADLPGVDVDALAETPLKLAPAEQQDPWETRRAWGAVFAAIERGDVRGVSEHKGAIEEAQRELRRLEEKEGETWPRLFFRRLESDPVASDLAAKIGEELNTGRTDGVWRFVGLEEAAKVQKPYHPGIEPTGKVKA